MQLSCQLDGDGQDDNKSRIGERIKEVKLYLKWLWLLNIFLAVLVLIFWSVGRSIPASDLSTTSGKSQNGLNIATNDKELKEML